MNFQRNSLCIVFFVALHISPLVKMTIARSFGSFEPENKNIFQLNYSTMHDKENNVTYK